MGNRFSYSCLARELSSRGCIVYALDHDDGTCSVSYSRKLNGFWIYEHIMDYLQVDTLITEYKHKIWNIRVPEIRELVERIKEDAKRDGNIDISKLSIIGHSMGSFAALESARLIDEIVSCVALDPYMRVL